VCGRPNALHKEWHEEKAREAESLRQAARDVTDAREAVRAAMVAGRRLVSLDEALLKRAGAANLAEQGEAVLRRLPQAAATTTPEDSAAAASELATGIEESLGPLSAAVNELRNAQADLAAREDAWRPHTLALAEWLPAAGKARKHAESLPNAGGGRPPGGDRLNVAVSQAQSLASPCEV